MIIHNGILSLTHVLLISSPVSSGLREKGPLQRQSWTWAGGNCDISNLDFEGCLEGSSAISTKREGRVLQMRSGSARHNSLYIPFACWRIHCMAEKWSLAECLGGKRKDLMDGSAHLASDHNYPSEEKSSQITGSSVFV